ncbi:hypothetical protein ACWGLF_39840 [Streptomyces puniciscabiei]
MYAEVEQIRGDSFRADWRITDLIRHAEQCGAPDPGVVCPDDGPESTALRKQVRAALKKKLRNPNWPAAPAAHCAAAAPCTVDDRRPLRSSAQRGPLQWMEEMTMETNPAALLLDLAAQAQRASDRKTLHDLLSAGHRAWCKGVADVQAGVDREATSLSDAQLAERCAAAGAPWEHGMTRGEAISALAFATWDAAPAAMAYTELEERAAHFGVCLLGEEVL